MHPASAQNKILISDTVYIYILLWDILIMKSLIGQGNGISSICVPMVFFKSDHYLAFLQLENHCNCALSFNFVREFIISLILCPHV